MRKTAQEVLDALKARENATTSRKRIVWKNNQPTLIEHYGTGEDITHKNAGNLYMGAVWSIDAQGNYINRCGAPWEKMAEAERRKAFKADELPVMSYSGSAPLPAAEYYGDPVQDELDQKFFEFMEGLNDEN